MGGVSFDHQVDPELMTGLLTASSILFGFSSLIILRPEFSVEEKKWLWILLLPPLSLIIHSGTSIGQVALGTGNAVQTTLFLISSFTANILSTTFVVGYYFAELGRKR